MIEAEICNCLQLNFMHLSNKELCSAKALVPILGSIEQLRNKESHTWFV